MSSPERKLILLAYYYPPENTSGATRPARFARYLPEFGWAPQVISAGDCGRDVHGLLPDMQRAPDHSTTPATRKWIAFAETLQRYACPYQEHLPWIPAAIEAGTRLARDSSVQAIYSTSPPIAASLAASVLKRRFPHLRWVADFRDPMVGNPFRAARRTRLYDPILEPWIFEHADVLVANTEAVAEMWRKRYPHRKKKIRTIWNGYDPSETEPAVEPPPGPPLVITHVGSLYADRHPGALLASLARLRRSGLDLHSWRVRLVGPMEALTVPLDHPSLGDLLSSGVIEANNAMVPRAEAAREMAAAHYLLLLDLNAAGTGLQAPAKLFDYLRCGSPILCFTARGSSVEFILERSGIPYVCVYMNDPDAEVDRKVSSFLKIPPTRQAPSNWFLENFDGVRQTETLSNLLAGTLD